MSFSTNKSMAQQSAFATAFVSTGHVGINKLVGTSARTARRGACGDVWGPRRGATMVYDQVVASTMISTTSHLLAANPMWIDKVAEAFNTLNMPTPLVEYGHPVMMGVMVGAMGFPGAYFGWQGRLNANKKEGVKQKVLHENVMVAFSLLALFGGLGGTLSVAMQGYDVFQSPHAISSAVVLVMLGLNAAIAYSGFTVANDGSAKGRLSGRKLHAYFGAATMAALLVHAGLGIKIFFE